MYADVQIISTPQIKLLIQIRMWLFKKKTFGGKKQAVILGH